MFTTFEVHTHDIVNTKKRIYQSAGSWGSSHYAMTNYEEYFAEGVSYPHLYLVCFLDPVYFF